MKGEGRLLPGSKRLSLLMAAFMLLALLACAQADPQATPTLRFIALGDQGTGNADQLRVAKAMKATIQTKGCDFILLLGDNFYTWGVSSVTDPQWESKYEAVYGVFGLPVYAVLGNHDYGNGGGTIDAAGARETAYVGPSDTWHMPAAWYKFDRGPARFVGLDTNWIKMHADDLGQTAEVAAWLRGFTGWKIVFGHHPWVSDGPHGNAGSYDGSGPASSPETTGARLAAFFRSTILGGTDLYLCGHDHDLEAFESISTSTIEVVSGGGGGGLYALAPSNADPDARLIFQARSFGFVFVTLDATSMTIEFRDSEGALLHRLSKSRKGG